MENAATGPTEDPAGGDPIEAAADRPSVENAATDPTEDPAGDPIEAVADRHPSVENAATGPTKDPAGDPTEAAADRHPSAVIAKIDPIEAAVDHPNVENAATDPIGAAAGHPNREDVTPSPTKDAVDRRNEEAEGANSAARHPRWAVKSCARNPVSQASTVPYSGRDARLKHYPVPVPPMENWARRVTYTVVYRRAATRITNRKTRTPIE